MCSVCNGAVGCPCCEDEPERENKCPECGGMFYDFEVTINGVCWECLEKRKYEIT